MSTKNQSILDDVKLLNSFSIPWDDLDTIDMEDYNKLLSIVVGTDRVLDQILSRCTVDVAVKMYSKSDIQPILFTLYMLVNGYKIEDVHNLLGNEGYLINRMHRLGNPTVLLLNDINYVNNANETLEDSLIYILNMILDDFGSYRLSKMTYTFQNVYAHLPHLDAYPARFKRKLKKKAMELKFEKGEDISINEETWDIRNVNLIGLFQNCCNPNNNLFNDEE